MKSLADSNSLERWWQEHSELDRLVRGLDATLARATLEKTLEALEELESVLDSHFAVEEGVYFPLIEKLSPDHGAIVRVARDSHLEICKVLDDLRQLVEGGQLAAARPVLNQLLEHFRVHEEHEAKLVADLEALQQASGY